MNGIMYGLTLVRKIVEIQQKNLTQYIIDV